MYESEQEMEEAIQDSKTESQTFKKLARAKFLFFKPDKSGYPILLLFLS